MFDSLLRIVLGPEHKEVQAKLKAGSQQRKSRREYRRARKAQQRAQAGQPPQGPAASPYPNTPPAASAGSPGSMTYPRPPGANGQVPAGTAPAQGPEPGETQRLRSGEIAAAATTQRVPPKQFPPAATPPADPAEHQDNTRATEQPFVPVDRLPPEPWWVRLRRIAVLLLAAVVVAAGVVSITNTALQWARPAPRPPAPPAASDAELAGTAEVVASDYLSWDARDKSARQAALARHAAPGVSLDGWDGNGRQYADAAAATGVSRGTNSENAIVTVRVRVTPFTGDTSSTGQQSQGDGALAAAPRVATAGGTPQPARWVSLAVPLRPAGAQVVATAPPVIVGSPVTSVSPPAVPDTVVADDAFANSTERVLHRLLTSYASGDLSYARAAGTQFAGLDGAATLGEIEQWHVRPLAPGDDPTRRQGDATVTWKLAGGEGTLTCSYLIELQQQDTRWYLAGLSAETEAIQQ